MDSRTSRHLTGFALGAIHVGALAAFIPALFDWRAIGVAAVISYFTGVLGVTLCYHRTLTHRSLRMRKPLEYFLAFCGTLALQGDPIRWVAIHRKHHAHADHEGDPHSIRDGFRWAHMDWLFRVNVALPSEDEVRRYAADLQADPFYRALKVGAIPLQLALALALFFAGGWAFVVWGIFVRLVVSYHSTWLVNSASHTFGYRTYRTNDRATNCWWVAMVSAGEGWHNNHHAFPFSARHGMQWFEFDLTWCHIRAMEFLRVADRIKIPTKAMQLRLERPLGKARRLARLARQTNVG